MGGAGSKTRTADAYQAQIEAPDVLDATQGVTLSGGDAVKQKVSVHHVVNQIFYSAPVRVSTMNYPKKSKRAGEEYIWIELDEAALDEQERQRLIEAGESDPEAKLQDGAWEKAKQEYPPGVSVDKIGDITVGAAGNTKPRKISGEDVMASFKLPAAPAPPRLVSKHAESIVLGWDMVLGLVDVFEVQYRVADPREDRIPWACFMCRAENDAEAAACSACARARDEAAGEAVEVVLDPRRRTSRQWEALTHASAEAGQTEVLGIQCGVPYVFRLRAHNAIGWSELSGSSQAITTLPEAPETPGAPTIPNNMLRSKRLLLYWEVPKANGSGITGFQVEGGAVQSEKTQLVFEGAVNYCVLDGLEPAQQYHYKVRAVNDIGASAFSEYLTVRTPALLPEDTKQSASAPYVSDWAEVLEGERREPVYVNVETSKVVTERPAAIDGPVDPIVEFRKKRFHFNRAILHDAPKGPAQVIRLNVDRDNLLWDSYEQLMQVQGHDLKKRIKVEYNGEEGIDAGGIGKDWFLEMSRQLFRSENGLFSVLGEGPDKDIKPNSPGPPRKDGLTNDADAIYGWYFFVGRFLGKAIFDRQLVDVQFSRTLFKQIFGKEVNIDDLRVSDPTLVKSMEWMLDNEIDNILFEEFCVSVDPPPWAASSEKIVVDLKPGGRNIEVDDENKAEYVELMLRWRAIDSCKDQIEAIRGGLFEIIPWEALQAADFDLDELDMLWNGLATIDVPTLMSTCVFQGGLDANHQLTHWFWKIFKSLEEEDKALLLRFGTGTSKLPVDGLEPPLKLTLNDQMDPESLCKAHSCFNQLVFPLYASEEVMRDKILYAIKNTDGFLLG